MNRYTLLLVDDEEEVIQIIMKKVDWESLGYTVAGYANNGVKALEMMEELQPDVVITDIKMPYMNGMELSQHIKEEFPATKILIFTGFDEFEYAREAIHLEVEEYILKPLNSAELSEILSRVKNKLDQEISEKRNVEMLQKYYLDSLPLLQVDFYTALLEERIRTEEVPQYLADYRISFDGAYHCCTVVHISSRQVPEGMTPKLLFAAVQKLVKERLEERWRAKCFTYLGNTILLAQMESESEVSELTDECDRFCRYTQRMIGAVVTVGIGKVCENIHGLSESYYSAREAVSYRVIYGAGRAINIREIAPVEARKPAISSGTEMTDLLKMIRLGTEQDIKEAVDTYLDHTMFPEKSLKYHHVTVMELLSGLYRFSVNNDVPAEDLFGDMKSLYGDLLEMEPKTLKKWLLEKSLCLREEIAGARSQSARNFIDSAKEYVHNYYEDENLSLNQICEALGVSNSYFSSVFKKETGNSFIGYLTDYRMEKASRLLLETNEKSYIIAKNVGYTDANYFSYVFKKKFGVSPSKYRTEYAKE